MSTTDDAELKIAKAKTQMILRFPFFAIVASRLQFVEVTAQSKWGNWLNTMATDGRHIFWSRNFVNELTIPELMFVCAHEVLHVVFMHMSRRGDRDPKIWNIACDYAINLLCEEAGFKMPQGEKKGFIDPKYKDWSAYQIYDDLMKNVRKITIKLPQPGKNGQQGEGDEGGWGFVMDATDENGNPVGEAERAQLEADIKETIAAAAQVQKTRGNLPGGLEGLIQAAGKNRVNWKDFIQNWVHGKVPDNYTWRRPNRKWMASHGIYMPRMELKGAGKGVLSIDTSGSVSDGELIRYITEIVAVIELLNPDQLTIIQHDAQIQRVDIWEAGMEFKDLRIKGRGGTMLMPSFKYAAGELKFNGKLIEDSEIDWMICFTDMEIGDFPKGKDIPTFPVLFAATGNDCAGFGTYIDLRGDGL